MRDAGYKAKYKKYKKLSIQLNEKYLRYKRETQKLRDQLKNQNGGGKNNDTEFNEITTSAFEAIRLTSD